MLVDSKCSPPDIMVCYRVKKNGSNHHTSANAANAHVPANGLNNHQTINSMSLDPQAQAKQSKLGARGNALKQSKSRELRASIMYTGCDCEKRNGLQDDCLRSECRGSPQCLTKPNPTCGPSEFSNGKHLELKRILMEQHLAKLKTEQKMADLSRYVEDNGNNLEDKNYTRGNESVAHKFNHNPTKGFNTRRSCNGNALRGNQEDSEDYCCYTAFAVGDAIICNGLEEDLLCVDDNINLLEGF